MSPAARPARHAACIARMAVSIHLHTVHLHTRAARMAVSILVRPCTCTVHMHRAYARRVPAATHNMLKVATSLLRWSADASYAEWTERALLNSVLGTQRGTEHGAMLYTLPLGQGVSKRN